MNVRPPQHRSMNRGRHRHIMRALLQLVGSRLQALRTQRNSRSNAACVTMYQVPICWKLALILRVLLLLSATGERARLAIAICLVAQQRAQHGPRLAGLQHRCRLWMPPCQWVLFKIQYIIKIFPCALMARKYRLRHRGYLEKTSSLDLCSPLER